MYDIKITNITNNEEITITITHGYRYLKPEFYGLNKKNGYEQKDGFVFIELVNLTKKNDSSLTCNYTLLFEITRTNFALRNFLEYYLESQIT